MKTYYRLVKEPCRIEEDGAVFEIKTGDRVLTSDVRDVKGTPSVTVLTNYWVTLPLSHFTGELPAYGHFGSPNSGSETRRKLEPLQDGR